MTNVRIGGTLFLPVVSGGLYLNAGELLDLLAGVVGYDPMSDDGIAKFRGEEAEAPPEQRGANWAAPVAPPTTPPPAEP
jgi:hypothetical protein